MAGEKEDLQQTPDGRILLVNRGKRGAAIVNISQLAGRVDLSTGLPDGTYRDMVYGKEFKVRKGRLTGILAPMRSYILQR